jgi:hypothetical protein
MTSDSLRSAVLASLPDGEKRMIEKGLESFQSCLHLYRQEDGVCVSYAPGDSRLQLLDSQKRRRAEKNQEEFAAELVKCYWGKLCEEPKEPCGSFFDRVASCLDAIAAKRIARKSVQKATMFPYLSRDSSIPDWAYELWCGLGNLQLSLLFIDLDSIFKTTPHDHSASSTPPLL